MNSTRLTFSVYSLRFLLIFQHYRQKKRDVSHAKLCSLYPPLTSHSGQLSFVLKILRLLVKDCCWLFIDCCYEAKTCLDLLQTCSHSQIIRCSCLVSVSTFQMKMFHVLHQHHQVLQREIHNHCQNKDWGFFFFSHDTIRMKQVHVKNGNNGMLLFVHETSGLNTGNRE